MFDDSSFGAISGVRSAAKAPQDTAGFQVIGFGALPFGISTFADEPGDVSAPYGSARAMAPRMAEVAGETLCVGLGVFGLVILNLIILSPSLSDLAAGMVHILSLVAPLMFALGCLSLMMLIAIGWYHSRQGAAHPEASTGGTDPWDGLVRQLRMQASAA